METCALGEGLNIFSCKKLTAFGRHPGAAISQLEFRQPSCCCRGREVFSAQRAASTCAQDGPWLERCLNAAAGGLIKLLKQKPGRCGSEATCLLVHFRNRAQSLGTVSSAAWAGVGGVSWMFQVGGHLRVEAAPVGCSG